MPGAWRITFVLVLFFGMAGFVWLMRRHFARRWDVPASRLGWISLGIALFGIAFAVVSSEVVRIAEAPLILETSLPGTTGMREGEPAVVRSARFEIAHPGREHRVSVGMVPERGVVVRGPVRLRVTLSGPGEAVLADTVVVLPTRARRSLLTRGLQWENGSVDFRPARSGRHVLRLVPLHPRIRRLEVQVTEITPAR